LPDKIALLNWARNPATALSSLLFCASAPVVADVVVGPRLAAPDKSSVELASEDKPGMLDPVSLLLFLALLS